ncbi:putative O-glycosylation ligase (exosortase A-associated) [Chitinivorax tropicus]|uniref:Putative O-glycosylation ligase (Exosortase A-associated) n=1 Tax=Chitinivorax tropicus TaxID=714531 RepID=A0A840MRN0_9PROT|nr:putative O-glycosylation ligase, exosortase A system-associated [Chitinivorax tropicus]MBB5018893.1 putative O-glycosylation ligase (exosortase A-associated) [Chitinivorax tropicus]
MRDLLLVGFILGSVPFILKRPWIGAVMWAWVSLMNPHRFTWGFAYNFQVAMIVGAATLLSLVMHLKEVKAPPRNAAMVALGIFVLWLNITLPFSFNLNEVYGMWDKVMKIMLMLFVTGMLIIEKKQIQVLIWVVALSIGLLGLKGGIFTVLQGGENRVWGPAGSFIEGNNEIGLAFIMAIPLMYYLHEQVTDKRIRWGVLVCIGSSAAAALGTHSRGALLAIAAMTFFLWLKSPRKLLNGFIILLLSPLLYFFMPDKWHDRMATIETYEEDASAMGRINAWKMAYNLASDNFFGGGFQIYDGNTFARYAPVPEDVHAAHSVYFQILGEHGFVGLFLYLLVGFLTWRLANRLIKQTDGKSDLRWISLFCRMSQVSIAGFAVGGAFLSLAYFDLTYYLLIIMSTMDRWLKMNPITTAIKLPLAAGQVGPLQTASTERRT